MRGALSGLNSEATETGSGLAGECDLTRHFLNEARHVLFMEGDHEKALQVLRPHLSERSRLSLEQERPLVELTAITYQKQKAWDQASELFQSIDDHYQAGYSQLLGGGVGKALIYWKPVLQKRPNHWCLSLYGMVTANLQSVPTFLQVRNHYEADMIRLWHNQQAVLANHMVKSVDLMAQINMEAYKYVGRALYHAGQLEQASQYLLKGQAHLPNDPEVYYYLGQYYFDLGQFQEAETVLGQCLLISSYYTPAKTLLQKIQSA